MAIFIIIVKKWRKRRGSVLSFALHFVSSIYTSVPPQTPFLYSSLLRLRYVLYPIALMLSHFTIFCWFYFSVFHFSLCIPPQHLRRVQRIKHQRQFVLRTNPSIVRSSCSMFIKSGSSVSCRNNYFAGSLQNIKWHNIRGHLRYHKSDRERNISRENDLVFRCKFHVVFCLTDTYRRKQ